MIIWGHHTIFQNVFHWLIGVKCCFLEMVYRGLVSDACLLWSLNTCQCWHLIFKGCCIVVLNNMIFFFKNDHSNNKVYFFVFCKEFINAWFFAISVMLHWVLGMFQSEFCILGKLQCICKNCEILTTISSSFKLNLIISRSKYQNLSIFWSNWSLHNRVRAAVQY